MQDPICRLLDHQEIESLLTRYTQMVDQRDWKRMDEVFTSTASIDYTSSGGVAGPYKETLAWLASALEPWPLNLHFISNFDIDIDGDRGRSSCYFLAPMGRDEPDGSQVVVLSERALRIAGSGGEILSLCNGERSGSDVALALGQRHPQAPRSADDVHDFLNEMAAAGALRFDPDPA